MDRLDATEMTNGGGIKKKSPLLIPYLARTLYHLVLISLSFFLFSLSPLEGDHTGF